MKGKQYILKNRLQNSPSNEATNDFPGCQELVFGIKGETENSENI